MWQSTGVVIRSTVRGGAKVLAAAGVLLVAALTQAHAGTASAPAGGASLGADAKSCSDCTAWLRDYGDAVRRRIAAFARLHDTDLAADLERVGKVNERRPVRLTLRKGLEALRDPDPALQKAAFDWLISVLPGTEVCLDCSLSPGGVSLQDQPKWGQDPAVTSLILLELTRYGAKGDDAQRMALVQLLDANPFVGLLPEAADAVTRFWRGHSAYGLSLRDPEQGAEVVEKLGRMGLEDPGTYEHLKRLAFSKTFAPSVSAMAAYYAALNRNAAKDPDAISKAWAVLDDPQATAQAYRLALMLLYQLQEPRVDEELIQRLSKQGLAPARRHALAVVLVARLSLSRADEWPEPFKSYYHGAYAYYGKNHGAERLRDVLGAVYRERDELATDHGFALSLYVVARAILKSALAPEDILRPVRDPQAAGLLARELGQLVLNDSASWLRIAERWKQAPEQSLDRWVLQIALLNSIGAISDAMAYWSAPERVRVRALLTDLVAEQRRGLADVPGRQSGSQSLTDYTTLEPAVSYLPDWSWIVGEGESLKDDHLLGKWSDSLVPAWGLTLYSSLDPFIFRGHIPSPQSFKYRQQAQSAASAASNSPYADLPLQVDVDPDGSEVQRAGELLDIHIARQSRGVASVSAVPADIRSKVFWAALLPLLIATVQIGFALPSLYYFVFDPARAARRACAHRRLSRRQDKRQSVVLSALGLSWAMGDLPYLLTYWIGSRPRCLWAWVGQQRPAARLCCRQLFDEAHVPDYFSRVPATLADSTGATAIAEVTYRKVLDMLGLNQPRRKEGPARRLVIHGPGGCGKTTMSIMFASWAMGYESPWDEAASSAETSLRYPLPLLIDQAFDLNGSVGESDMRKRREAAFIESVERAARGALPQSEVDAILVRDLLRAGAILPLIDHFSEAPESTREAVIDTLSDADLVPLCMLTSRDDERSLGQHAGISRLQLLPLNFGLASDLYRMLVEAHLKNRGEEMRADDLQSYYPAQAQLGFRTLGTADGVSPLMVSLIARLALGRIERARVASGNEMSEPYASSALGSIVSEPELVRMYVGELAWDAGPDHDSARRAGFLTRVLVDAKALAWGCMRNGLVPGSLESGQACAILEAESPDEAFGRLETLLHNVRLLRNPSPSQHDRIRFALDPVCEFLAGLYLVDRIHSITALPQDDIDKVVAAVMASPDQGFPVILQQCVADAEASGAVVVWHDRMKPLRDALRIAQARGDSVAEAA